MKNIVKWLLCFLPVIALAQEKGVQFQHGLTWEQVQAKAKADKKYIFMDCFTTWCGPCKYMSAQIFPQEAVADLMNTNFINVRMQLDTTDNDNEEVKSWYATGHRIAADYNVMAYPTFLIFDQDGKLVHRIVGASQSGEEFIAKAKEAMDPSKQYYPMLAKYKAGQKDSTFLFNLAIAALHAYDDQTGAQVVNDYLSTQKDIYTPKTLNLLQSFTQSSNDKGFGIMLQHPDKVDAVLGKGVAENQVNRIIFYENVVPVLFNRYAPIAGEPNWNKLKDSIAVKYPSKADEVLAYSKVLFYLNRQQWNDFGPAIVAYMKSYGDNVSQSDLNEYAWAVFQNCSDETCLKNALEWSKRSFEKEQNPAYMDTYANLLYRLGRKDEAIEWEQKALSLVTTEDQKKGYQQTIEKMKAGEKTWN